MVTGVKLYIDEDASENSVVLALRHHGVDVLTVVEAGQDQQADEVQLNFASTHGRAIYSLNVGHFALLHQQFLARGEEHAGIILIPRHRYGVGEKIRKLLELLENTDAQSLRNSLRFL
jgi:hypothetical protein